MKQLAILLALLMAFGALCARVTVRHDPPMALKADREAVLTLEVMEGFDEISEVNLYYREAGSPSYVNITLERQAEPSYTFTVPRLEHPEKGLEYYFEVSLSNNTVQTLPGAQPALNPYRVQFDRVEAPSDEFVLLSPEPGPVSAGEPLVIAISTFALADQLDPESVTVTYDGKDMTSQAQVSGNMIVLRIEKPSAGVHTYQVAAALRNGRQITSRAWQSKAGGGEKFEMPLHLTGRIDMNSLMRSFSADDSAAVSDDDDLKWADWNINMRGNAGWLGFYTRMMLSSRETASNQPVDRLVFGLTTPMLDVAYGDQSPEYDTFTMNNKNVRGLHALFHASDFRMNFDWGQSRRAVENNQNTSFTRNTFAFRTEVGELDAFQWGISVVKNKDDEESIDEDYYMRVSAEGDTTYSITPKDNLVIGTDFLFPFIPRKLELGFETAFSLYNSNTIPGVISQEDLDDYGVGDIPFDPDSFEDIIVINKNLEPFVPGSANMAYRGFINANLANNFLTASYAQVGASFNSLCANYVQKDARIIGLNDNMMLFRNQFMLSLGLNLITDNLSDQKETTNNNTSYYVQAVVRPNGMPTFKLGFSQSDATDDGEELENSDTGYVYGTDQSSQTVSAGVSYEVEAILLAPTTFEVNWQQTGSTDNLNNSYDNTMNTVSLSGTSRFRDLPLTTVVRYSYTASDQKNMSNGDYTAPLYDESSDTYNSLLLKGNLRFFDDRLKPYASMQFTGVGGDSDAQGIQIYGLGTAYQALENLSATTGITMKNYANSDTRDVDYSKFDWRLRLTYNF